MIKQIRVDRDALAQDKPSIQVNREDGLEKLYYQVEILGPSTVKSKEGKAWVETNADVIGLPERELV